ncbi:MAG: hypothetical protein LBG43_06045 [Treponema sp.]|nr:hypothetical protein [Treponema sp.]
MHIDTILIYTLLGNCLDRDILQADATRAVLETRLLYPSAIITTKPPMTDMAPGLECSPKPTSAAINSLNSGSVSPERQPGKKDFHVFKPF